MLLNKINLRNEKIGKLEKLDETLKNSGERLIEFSEECHGKFQATREQVNKRLTH
jgi:hypothetical protein